MKNITGESYLMHKPEFLMKDLGVIEQRAGGTWYLKFLPWSEFPSVGTISCLHFQTEDEFD